jgi:hypothetical protein
MRIVKFAHGAGGKTDILSTDDLGPVQERLPTTIRDSRRDQHRRLFRRSAMKKLAALSAVALISLSTLTPGEAEARSRRNVAGAAIAAGVVGLAVGGLLASQAQAAPSYGNPAYQPDYGYRPAPVRYRYVDEARVVDRPVRRYKTEYTYSRPVTVRRTIVERRYETAPVYDSYGDDYGW